MISGPGEIIRAHEASPMEKNLRVLGNDMAKQIFHPIGLDEPGQIVWRKRPTRQALLPCIAPLSPAVKGMEVCGGTHYSARRF